MYIVRNGVKYELTVEELEQAYDEVQKQRIKDDIELSFEEHYLYLEDLSSGSFEEFIRVMSDDVVTSPYWEVYQRLCEDFGQKVVAELIEKPNEFLQDAYKMYVKDEDANVDYNTGIDLAVKSVLCERAFKAKIDMVQEELDKGASVPEGVGFKFKGTWIVNPFYEETGRFEVDPISYYGDILVNKFVTDYLNSKNEEKSVDNMLSAATDKSKEINSNIHSKADLDLEK